VLVSSSLSSTISLPITTVGAVIYFVVAAVSNRPPPVRLQVGKAAEMYLRQNALTLQENLATGSGVMIQNFASALEMKKDHVARFGKLMQSHRAEFTPLLDEKKLDPERAMQFLRLMASTIEQDEVLLPGYQAFLKHHASQG